MFNLKNDEDLYGKILEGEESKLDATIHAENVSYLVVIN